MFGCKGKDWRPQSFTPNTADPLPLLKNTPKSLLNGYLEQPGGYPLPHPETDISTEPYETNELQYATSRPAKSSRREQLRWSRRRSRRKSEMEDVSDARSIASTTKQLIEYYRLQSGLGGSATRAANTPTPPETSQVPSVPPLPRPPSVLFGIKAKRTSNCFSRGRFPKVPRLKVRAESPAPTAPSMYSQGSIDTRIAVPRMPSPVAASWQEEALVSAGLVYHPEPSTERRGSTAPLLPLEHPPSPSPVGSAIPRIPASRKRSIVARTKGRIDKFSTTGNESEDASRWI
ncbi:hypothetical protein CPB83DRAFT_668818 [Crepidotus variabilis]|uniref:Uncharacterized protein n=1 Tax=Crepidotus variabilis TaxID=179855 RepID=A0A9P6ENU8_9AGAR|nr:hypothetical protein CPB83DRAFT_668818 [Crepidotus variabilis]